MKVTIETLQQKADKAKQFKEDLEKRIAAAETRITGLEAEADIAAANGEIEAYREAKAQIELANDEISVSLAQLEAGLFDVTQPETIDAWWAYCSTYSPKLKKQLQEVDRARDSYLSAYKAAVDLQREACAARERLAGFIGMTKDDLQIPILYPLETAIKCRTAADGAAGLLRTGGTTASDPDLVFYLTNLKMDVLTMQQDPGANEIQAVVRQQKTGGFTA